MEVILERILRRLSGIPNANLTTFTDETEKGSLQKALFYVLNTCSSELLADNLIRILLNIGANPQAQDRVGNTPLHFAVEKSFPGKKKTRICLFHCLRTHYQKYASKYWVNEFRIRLEASKILRCQRQRFLTFCGTRTLRRKPHRLRTPTWTTQQETQKVSIL